MQQQYENTRNSERTVEVLFIEEVLQKYCSKSNTILDIGGVPTNSQDMAGIYDVIQELSLNYKVSDFRQCDYPGDFVHIDFGSVVFDACIFLSSLEHFPQCTESDTTYRDGYDRAGFIKALSILRPGGYIFLTVPYGKHVWQPYHQNYDYDSIRALATGSRLVVEYTYRLEDAKWILSDPKSMSDVLYKEKAYGVGCFVFQK